MRKEATLKKLLTEDELNQLTQLVPHGQTPIWTYWEPFIDDWLLVGKSNTKASSIRDTMKLIIKSGKILTVEGLNNAGLLREAMNQMSSEREWCGSTFNTYLTNICSFLNWLVRYEYIEVNNAHKLEKHREQWKMQRTLNQEQVDKTNAAVRMLPLNDLLMARNQFFLSMLTYTGARCIELLLLTTDSIRELPNGKFEVLIENRKRVTGVRPFLLTDGMTYRYLQYMRQRERWGRSGEKYLFVSGSKRTAWTYIGVKRLLEQIAKVTGFSINTRAFRRYVATTIYQSTKDLTLTSIHLGHNRTSTTRSYIESSNINTERSMDALEKANEASAHQWNLEELVSNARTNEKISV